MVKTKICNKCKIQKELTEFHSNSLGHKGVRSRCKLCRNEDVRIYYRMRGVSERQKMHKNSRDWHYKNRYKLTVDEVDAWKLKINFTCQVCNKQVDASKLHIDHCHKTNRVRDLLCNNCNAALGHVNDNVELLEKLKQYILKWEEEWLTKE